MNRRPAPSSDAALATLLPLLNRLRASVLAGQLDHLGAHGFVGLTPGTVAMLPFIGPLGARPIVLAEQTGMTRQAAGQTLREMAARGFITVTDDPTDERAKLARFTAKGETLRDAGLAAREAIRLAAEAAIGGARVATWLADAALLAAAIGNDEA